MYSVNRMECKHMSHNRVSWEVVLLAFRLCCLTSMCLNCLRSFPIWCIVTGEDSGIQLYRFQIIDFSSTCSGADPGFLDWGFKLAEGGRFVQFVQFFLKFPMKMK